jgi:ribosomal protein S18 acetylase RimI-like enzyme
MSLPILYTKPGPSRANLVRLFHQTESQWSQHLADEETLEIGTAFSNPQLSSVYDANNVRDVQLPPGMTPAAAVDLVGTYYAQRKTSCAYWTMNPSAPESATRPMVEYLLSAGYRENAAGILLLTHTPKNRIAEAGGLKIIPARASYRHTRILAEESARSWGAPELAEAWMLHLDDPHWEALLALKDGVPAAYIGVLTMGEVGRIDEVYVGQAFRGQGIGTTMLSRILEVCGRAMFKHVMLSVLPENAAGVRLYSKFGFETIGQITAYFAKGPWH